MTALLESERDVRALKGPRLCTVGTGTAEQAGPLRHQGRPGAGRVPRRGGRLRRIAAAGPLDGVARAAAARRHRPRGHRRPAAGGRRASSPTSSPTARVLEDAQREGGPRRLRHAARGADRRRDVHERVGGAQLRQGSTAPTQAADLLKNTVVAAIGPVTADAARQLGIPVTVQPATYTIPALVDAIAAHYVAARARHRTEPRRTRRSPSGLRTIVRGLLPSWLSGKIHHGCHDRTRLALTRRPRRLRRTEAIRRLVRETRLTPDCFIYPLFVCEGRGVRREIASMPGVFQLSVDEAVKEAAAAQSRRRARRAPVRPARRARTRPARRPPIPRRRCRRRCAR